MLKTEFAPAKLNLTLEVLGRRPDGFHEIRSLVAFAKDVGDRLTLGPGRFSATETTGPFAAEIAEGNLVDKAFAAISAAVPGFEFERLTLEKIAPKDDPALNLWTVDGYRTDAAKWPPQELERSRMSMLKRIAELTR